MFLQKVERREGPTSTSASSTSRPSTSTISTISTSAAAEAPSMTRRGSKSTTASGQRMHQAFVSSTTSLADGKTTDVLLRKHRLLRRASMPMLARKYRTRWRSGSRMSGAMAPLSNQSSPSGSASGVATMSKTFTREELINFWRDLPLGAKRPLLRIHRDVFLTALDQFLVRHNLCCECHDNVIAEWEDHEHRRAASRSLLDVFSVFPPFLDDDEEDDEEDEEDDEDEDEDRLDDSEDSDDMLEGEAVLMHDEEVVFKYELDREEFRRARTSGLLSDEYLAALEIGKRQEDELLRLIQKEERYIIIREDHPEFIMDLIRCGDEFSYVEPFRRGLDDSDGEEEDENEDGECPGANTSHLAQEYLLEVLAIKFREQLENAYQAALQHSLAVQAELLRDEIADLQQSQKPSSSQKKKKKERQKKKKQKKTKDTPTPSVSGNGTPGSAPNTSTSPRSSDPSAVIPSSTPSSASKAPSEQSVVKPSPLLSIKPSPPSAVPTPSTMCKDPRSRPPELHKDTEDPTDHDVDREVEEFRLLLEKIHAQSTPRQKPKLVLPPGAFRSV